MDLRGYELISRTLEEGGINATVSPEPAEGQHLEYATIDTDTDLPPAEVLNALGRASLLHRTDARDTGMRSGPNSNHSSANREASLL